jgi:hypothetical protein
MPCSVARALGSTSVMLVAGSIVRGDWQRVWGMALSSVPWAVDLVCGVALT